MIFGTETPPTGMKKDPSHDVRPVYGQLRCLGQRPRLISQSAMPECFRFRPTERALGLIVRRAPAPNSVAPDLMPASVES